MPSASAIRYFGTVVAHEKLPVKPGYCSATDTGSGYACSARERKGFWYASTLEGCAELCEACPKCNYFSFSRNLTDCSWFESCATQYWYISFIRTICRYRSSSST